MVWLLGAQTDTRTVIEPKATTFGLPGWNLQPLAPPDPLDPLVVDDPAGLLPQQFGDLAITVTAILAGEFDDVGGKLVFVIPACTNTALCRAMLPKHATHPPFRNSQDGPHMIDASTATRGAQKFPRAASARIILSSVRSETARRSRVFSASNAFSRFT